jgi:hypothetical protein
MYHARDGLFFERQADGSVKVRLEKDNGAAMEITLPADTWASAMASVSARGETLDTWNEARQYHNRTREGVTHGTSGST